MGRRVTLASFASTGDSLRPCAGGAIALSLSPTGDRRERPQFIFDKAGKPVAMTSGMARDWDSAPLRRNGAAARG